jgi:hypothetical protein
MLGTDAVNTVTRAPDDGWRHHLKHVEQFTDINKLYIVAYCWIIIGKKIKPLKCGSQTTVLYISAHSPSQNLKVSIGIL